MNENTVSTQTLLAGFGQAYGRYKVAKNERDDQKVFIALFETLNWAVSILFRLEKNGDKASKNPLLGAIKFIRNCVHHQWADALMRTEGMALPVELPAPFHEWLWKPVDKLPKDRPGSKGEDFYKKLLENKPARYSLEELHSLFSSIK